MSGGAVVYADENGEKLVPGVAAIIGRGFDFEGDPSTTTAMSILVLYGYRWKANIGGAASFRDLLQMGLVHDRGEDRSRIEVVDSGSGWYIRRRSIILKPEVPLLLPRRRPKGGLLLPKRRKR
jgi:hypothetical protein